MRIVHLNLTDSGGGAAIAARRLHVQLRREGHDSRMLVWRKYTDDRTVQIFDKRPLPRAVSQLAGRTLDAWGMQYLFHPASMTLPDHPWVRDADVINLHLSHGSYLSTRVLPELSRRAPIVWTMHDMWAATGHCAFAAADECDHWLSGCGHCPRLDDSPAIRFDTTHMLWRLKSRTYGRSRLTVVCPSAWLADKMVQSPLLRRFPIHTVANGLDTEVFRPLPKAVAREALRLPQDRTLLMFGAAALHSVRKGAQLLERALAALPEDVRANLTLLLVGAQSERSTPSWGNLPVVEMGGVDSEVLMALCYAAADIFVMPSLAENLPNSLVEALACGTPCVCYAIGGCPEIVEHMRTGYLARPGDVADLAQGITFLARETSARSEMGERASLYARRTFDARHIAARYLEIYEEARSAPAVSAR